MDQPGARQPYSNPPIIEALVEFRFKAGSDWDMTIPGKLHQHPTMAAVYRGKPRTQKIMHAAITASAGQAPAVAMQEAVGRVQLIDEQGTRLVALAQDVISINTLRPYEGWVNFRPRIEAGVRTYAEVTGTREVVRIGVRYINRVEIPHDAIDTDTYFVDFPKPPAGMPNVIGTFFSRVEYDYDDRCKLVLTQCPMEDAAAGKSAFLLDLDVIWDGAVEGAREQSLSIDAALKLADDLHDREKRAFEALITDDTRRLFNAL